MTANDVILLANRAATDVGYKLDRYTAPKAKFNFVRKDGAWTVFYEMKPPTPPGGHFQVWVNDKTGKMKLMRGE